MVVEFVVGFLANSLALIADAGHMLNDVFSILLGLVAISLGKVEGPPQLTFGYKRVEVLSGLINGLSLLGISYFIIYEAIVRFGNLETLTVEGPLVLVVGVLGLLVNIGGVLLLTKEKEGSINIEGVYHHVMADALGSVAAIVAGVGIILFKAFWLDLVVSVLVSILIVRSGVVLTLKSLKILIQATPEGIDLNLVRSEISGIPGVQNVHDLHAWRVTDGMDVITAHIIVNEDKEKESIKSQASTIASSHGFNHMTFQVESDCQDPTAICD